MDPNCSSCSSSFQVGRGGASGAPDSALVSVSTQQWLPRDLQVIKGQKSKRVLSQVLGSLILHVPQQGVGTCLAQSGRDAAEAPARREVQGCASIEHAGIYSGTRLKQELHQAPLLGLHGQVQCRLPTRALLHVNVCSVLKQQFHEWLVPLQGSDVETGQTLPVLQLEVQGVSWTSAWLWPPLQEAAGTSQVLALAGHMQGSVTVPVL